MWQAVIFCVAQVAVIVSVLSVIVAGCSGGCLKKKKVAEKPKETPVEKQMEEDEKDKTAASEAETEHTQQSQTSNKAKSQSVKQESQVTQDDPTDKKEQSNKIEEQTAVPIKTEEMKSIQSEEKQNQQSNDKEKPAPATFGDLKLEPGLIKLCSTGQIARHRLTNTGTSRLAAKLKCSDNVVYRLAPVYSILDPGMTIEIDVQRLPAPKKMDLMVIETTMIGPEETDVPGAFRKPGTVPLKAQVVMNVID